MPKDLHRGGIAIIIKTVKIIVMPTPRVNSDFFALQAAETAIAADTPHTDVAAAMIMVRCLDAIFNHLVPKSHIKIITVGVTTHATKRPGKPSLRISEKRISPPRSTRPVLMNISDLAPFKIHSGVPTVFAMSKPKESAQIAYPSPQALIEV